MLSEILLEEAEPLVGALEKIMRATREIRNKQGFTLLSRRHSTAARELSGDASRWANRA
jgi:hypothetical protein